MTDPKDIAALRASLDSVVAEWNAPNLYTQLNLVDAVFAIRLLLGRNPNRDRELPELVQLTANITLKEFLSRLTSSDEFTRCGGFIPPNRLLMAELEDFRFWFDTRDTEMEVRMGLGLYEPESISFFRRVIKPGMICWDIGAQTGLFTCLFAVLAGERGKVYAYEPLPRSFEILEKNLRENAFGGRVSARKAACSDSMGQVRMVEASNMFVVDPEGPRVQAVDCIRLDQEAIPLPDLIKIDVEGHEPAVLRGLSGILERCDPTIVVELNEYWLTTKANATGASVIQSLEQAGYAAFRMENPSERIRGDEFSQGELGNCNIVARRSGKVGT